MHGKARDLLCGALHALDDLWEQEGSLVLFKGDEHNFTANLAEVGLIGRRLLQDMIVRGESHSLDVQSKFDVDVHDLETLECSIEVRILDHLVDQRAVLVKAIQMLWVAIWSFFVGLGAFKLSKIILEHVLYLFICS